jgi:hypothetical protein
MGLEKGKVGVQEDSRRSGFAANLFIGVLAIALTLGALELVVRAFVGVRNVGPAFTVYDPVYGKRLKANLRATRVAPEFRFDISTNSLGMRDPEPAKSPTDGIVFVGDSFTEGYGVADSEAFPAVVRAGLESRGVAVPVLNTGMGNNGNGRWVKFFEHDAAKFRPRIVVFQVMANDFDDNLAEHLFQIDGNGALRELPIPPPSLTRKVETLVDATPGLPYSHLVSLMWMAAERIETNASGHGPSADTDNLPSDRLTYALIGSAVDKARAGGADVIGLLVGLSGERRAKVMQIFRERGLTCLDGPSQRATPGMFYKVDGHWNAAGHRRAAELLLPEILRRVGQSQTAVE